MYTVYLDSTFHLIQLGNKSFITPACLLITLTFRHKETLRVINTIII